MHIKSYPVECLLKYGEVIWIYGSTFKLLDQQLRFVSKIGASEVEQDIQQKVKYLTKKVAHRLEEENGVVVPI